MEIAVQAVRTPEIRARLIGQGSDPVGNSPQEFAAFLSADYDKHGAAVKQAGLKVE